MIKKSQVKDAKRKAPDSPLHMTIGVALSGGKELHVFPFIPPTGAKSLFYRCEIHPAQTHGELPVK